MSAPPEYFVAPRVPGVRPVDPPDYDGITFVYVFTNVLNPWTQPAALANVTLQVANSQGFLPGMTVVIENAGYYTVVSTTALDLMTVQNSGATWNQPPGTGITPGKITTTSLPGPPGSAGPQGIQGNAGPTGPQGSVGPPLNLKGTVATSSALPTSGNTTNDVWIALDTGHGWGWIGSVWVDLGPMQGPAGVAGATGSQGPAGATGPAGSAGPTGATGPAGPQGQSIIVKGTVPTSASLPTTGNTQGDIWIAQDTGHGWCYSSGVFNDIGPFPMGATGPMGPPGSPGATGASGPVGAQGIQGNPGVAGPQGIPGPIGPTGSTGASGSTGATGAPGAPGSPGANGATGSPAWTTTTAAFTIPSSGGSVTISVVDTSWVAIGENVWIQTTSTTSQVFQVTAKTPTTLTLLNPPSSNAPLVSTNSNNAIVYGTDSLVYLSTTSIVPPTRSVGTTNSLTGGGALTANLTLQLVGDSASPGNFMTYSTDGSGTKGWHAGAAGGGGITTFSSFTAPASGASVTVTVASAHDLITGMSVVLSDGTHFMSGKITAVTPVTARYTVFSSGTNPSGNYNGFAQPVTSALNFYVSSAATVTGLRFYKWSTDTSTSHMVGLFDISTGSLLVSQASASEPAGGNWVEVTLTTPYALTANHPYQAAALQPVGFDPYTNNVFTSSIINGPLIAYADGAVPTIIHNGTKNASSGSGLSFAGSDYDTQTWYGNDVVISGASTYTIAITNDGQGSVSGTVGPGDLFISDGVGTGTGGGISDAPSNGTSYARNSAAWSPLYQVLTSAATFAIPAAGSTATITLVGSGVAWGKVGETFLITDGTSFMYAELTTRTSNTSWTVTNRGYNGNAVTGTMGASALVALATPGLVTASQPGFVPAPPNNAAQFLNGTGVFSALPANSTSVAGTVAASPNDANKVYLGNSTFGFLPMETETTAATFSIPALGSTVTITLSGTGVAWGVVGETIAVTDGTNIMLGELTTRTSNTSWTLTNRGYAGFAVTGTMAVSALVYVSGPGFATATQPGTVPTPPNDSTKYLSGVGSWTVPPGSGGAASMRVCFQAGIDGSPPSTLYATFGTQNSRPHLAYNDSATWTSYYFGYIPTGITLTTGLQVRLKWKSITTNTGNVMWSCAFSNLNTTEASDSFGTAVTATTACSATTSVLVESLIQIPNANLQSLAAGNPYGLIVQRIGANAADTMVGDACLRLVIVENY